MDEADQFVIDFTVIKQVIDKYDHAVLAWVKDKELLEAINPLSNSVLVHLEKESTAENLAEAIAHDIALLVGARTRRIFVEVQETPKGKAQYIYEKSPSDP